MRARPVSLALRLCAALLAAATGCVIPVQVGLERPVNEPPTILGAIPDFLSGDLLPADGKLGFTVWARDPEVEDTLYGRLYIVNPTSPPTLTVDPLELQPVTFIATADPTVREGTWASRAYCSDTSFAGRRTVLAVYVTDSVFYTGGFGPSGELPPSLNDGGVATPPYDYKTWRIDCE